MQSQIVDRRRIAYHVCYLIRVDGLKQADKPLDLLCNITLERAVNRSKGGDRKYGFVIKPDQHKILDCGLRKGQA